MSIRKMKIQQGYIVYQIPAEEIVKLREEDCFGNLCDSCNQTIEDTYYIPVLNWGMCKKCFLSLIHISEPTRH